MTDLRLDRLEASIRRLRTAVAVLAFALIGVITIAAAPAEPSDLKVRKLIASEVVLEEGQDKLSLRPGSILLRERAGSAELTGRSLRLRNTNIEAQMEIGDTSASVSLMTLDQTKMPSSVSLNLSAVPKQTPYVIVNDGERRASLLPTGIFPPAK